MLQESVFQRKHRLIAEGCAKRMAEQNWRDRRHTIESAIKDVRRNLGGLAAGTLVASVLAQLDVSAIVDNDQALIFAMSDSIDHQVAACDWFAGRGLDILATPEPRPDANRIHGATIH